MLSVVLAAAALLMFEGVVAALPQDALESGRIALQGGDLVRAEKLFREFLASHPHSAEALSNLAAVYARREQFDQAVPLYQRALQTNPQLTPVHFSLAASLGRLKQYSKAADHLLVF